MEFKLLTRDQFREGTFERDGHKCVNCGSPAKDAHHILERRLWPDGGYYLENGASVCEPCHILCEQTVISVEEIREKAGITKAPVPPHLYPDHIYDKWGNHVLTNGRRIRGELFFDESVQKILGQGGVLDLFLPYVKYQRTFHMPWSPGIHDDDKALPDMSKYVGKRVVVTEKMDGECLPSTAKIHLANGTTETIGNIVSDRLVGLEVLGINADGELVPTKITRVYNNGTRTEPWVRISYIGQSGKKQSLICTKNHKICTNTGYKESHLLQPGDVAITYVPEIKISQNQRAVILGKLLGDGSLHVQRRRSTLPVTSALVQYSHKAAHKEYSEWTDRWLGELFSNSCVDNSPRYGNTSTIKSWSKQSTDLFAVFGQMVEGPGKKVVCRSLLEIASPLTIAFWYMDDGSLSHSHGQQDRAIISVCNFDNNSVEVLQELLMKFNISSSRYQHGEYEYLYLSNTALKLLSALIWQYVPPCMQYKLATEYRNRVPIAPFGVQCEYGYKPINTKILHIDQEWETKYTGKYDIETELHNYVANGIVVHNCTSMYSDYIHARSIDSGSHPSRSWVKNLWSQISMDIPEGWRVVAENVYAVHSIRYNNLESFVYGLSVWNEVNVCLSWDETKEWLELLGLKHPRVLYDGIYDEVAIRKLYDEKTMWDKSEGYVLRIADSFPYGAFKDSVCKYVRSHHVQTNKHWMRGQPIEVNGLAQDEETTA